MSRLPCWPVLVLVLFVPGSALAQTVASDAAVEAESESPEATTEVLTEVAAPEDEATAAEPAPSVDDIDAEPAPVAAPPVVAPRARATTGEATASYELGRGFTIRAGDVFSTNLQSRVQIRSTFVVSGEDADPMTATPGPTNETQIRTLRLWLRGNVLEPNIRYGIQLALGSNDFEAGNASPID